jgi:hypothetical protein
MKRLIRQDQILAYNIANLSGLAFSGKIKPYAEHFPMSEDEKPEGVSSDGAKMLSALFKLKSRGVPMQVERISLH